MKLSISNIAWTKDEDEQVYRLMVDNGFTGLDIAPARIFENPFEVEVEAAKSFKNKMKDMGIEVVGMQSLLYKTEGLNIFGTPESRYSMFKHLIKMMDYAKKIGVKILVFGSPKNRLIGNMEYKKAEKIAIGFFSELADYAKRNGLIFCIEPNPKDYGADFLTNTIDAANFVKKVNNDGLGLHMDMGTILMNNEDIEGIIEAYIDIIKHIHISHPHLDIVNKNKDEHILALKGFKKMGL